MQQLTQGTTFSKFMIILSTTGLLLWVLFLLTDQIFINRINLILSMFAIITASIAIGYLVCLPIRSNFNVSKSVLIPFFGGIGFCINFLWIYSVSFFTLHWLPIFSLVFVAFIFNLIFSLKNLKNNTCKIRINRKKQEILIPIFVFILLVLVMNVIWHFQYPILFSDLSDYHTMLTQSILNNGKLTPYYHPDTEAEFGNKVLKFKNPIGYPPGWHTTVANFAKFFDLNSLQQGFALTGITISIIFGLLCFLSYRFTQSIILTIFVIGSFFFNSHVDPQAFLYGFFIVGLGPITFGIIGILTLLSFIFITDKKRNYLHIVSLIIISIGLSHPPMIIYSIIIVISYILLNSKNMVWSVKKSLKNMIKPSSVIATLVLFLVIFGMFVGSGFTIQTNIIKNFINPQGGSIQHSLDYMSVGRGLDVIPELNYFLIVLTISALFLVFYSEKTKVFSALCLVLIASAVFSTYLGNISSIFTPIRINPLIVPLSWVLLAICVKFIQSQINLTVKNKNIFKYNKKIEEKPFNKQLILRGRVAYSLKIILFENVLFLLFGIVTILLFFDDFSRFLDVNSYLYDMLPDKIPECKGWSLRCS